MPSIEGLVADRRILIRVFITSADPAAASFSVEPAVGLIDTGAQMTAISETLVDRLRFPRREKKPIHGVNGVNLHYRYFFRLGFELTGSPAPYMLDATLDGIGRPPNLGFDVLIGMDVLQHCDLHVRRNRSYTLALP